jgi:hypothetical protein
MQSSAKVPTKDEARRIAPNRQLAPEHRGQCPNAPSARGLAINRVAKLVGLSNGTVQRLKDELIGRPFDGVAA